MKGSVGLVEGSHTTFFITDLERRTAAVSLAKLLNRERINEVLDT